MSKYNVKATSGYISKYKLVAMLDKAKKNETNGFVYVTYEKAIEITETMDDAEVAPVVHGRWIEVYANNLSCECLYCSMCGYREFEERTYCAHCGARMDLKESEEKEKPDERTET